MRCEDASRALIAGEPVPELELHLSACDECRLLSEDLGEIGRAFARAREAWAPSPGFRVRLPAAPWKRLAIAASLLVLPLAAGAIASLRPGRPGYDLSAMLDPRPTPSPSDRETLARVLLEDSQP